MAKFKIILEIEGTQLADNLPLTKGAIEDVLQVEFSMEDNEFVDTHITSMKVMEVRKPEKGDTYPDV